MHGLCSAEPTAIDCAYLDDLYPKANHLGAVAHKQDTTDRTSDHTMNHGILSKSVGVLSSHYRFWSVGKHYGKQCGKWCFSK